MTGVWVTADTITAARMNEKTIFQGTGVAINGLTTYAGMLAFCTSTGSGFTINHLYQRNTANSAWYEIPTITDITPTTNDIVYYDGTTFNLKQPTLEMLDNHTASGVESTYTYTPSTALDFTTYSKVFIVYQLQPTAGFDLQCVLNATGGTANASNGARITGAAIAHISATGAAQLQLASTNITGAADDVTCGEVSFYGVDAVNDAVLGQSDFIGTTSTPMKEFYTHRVSGIKTITSINSKTSTSTWKAGSIITTYGLRRA